MTQLTKQGMQWPSKWLWWDSRSCLLNPNEDKNRKTLQKIMQNTQN